MNIKGNEKLHPRLYGPYRVTIKVGDLDYELELPKGSKIHNVFHVSCLKKEIGKKVVASKDIPDIDDEGHLELIPKEIFQVKENNIRNITIK